MPPMPIGGRTSSIRKLRGGTGKSWPVTSGGPSSSSRARRRSRCRSLFCDGDQAELGSGIAWPRPHLSRLRALCSAGCRPDSAGTWWYRIHASGDQAPLDRDRRGRGRCADNRSRCVAAPSAGLPACRSGSCGLGAHLDRFRAPGDRGCGAPLKAADARRYAHRNRRWRIATASRF